MKQVLVALLVLAALAVPAVAQMGDARAYGLAEALTAVGDDANALIYNPAGLAFVRHGFLNADANACVQFKGTPTMDTDDYGNSYTSNNMVPNYMDINPRLLVGGKHWAATAYQRYQIWGDFSQDYFLASVSRDVGAAAGLGLAIGPFAVGANVRYDTWTDYKLYMSSSFTEDDTMNLVKPSADTTLNYMEWEPELKVGLGAILTLGSINLGIYNGNVMPFLDKDAEGNLATAFLETMNLGVSWMPSDNKFSDSKFPLVLMTSLDLRNFGDVDDYIPGGEYRMLNAGAEIGLDAGNFLVALARAGYSQPLPGPIADMFDGLDPRLGRIYAGATGKFWFAKVDLCMSFPIGFMFSEDETVQSSGPQSMTMALTASLAF